MAATRGVGHVDLPEGDAGAEGLGDFADGLRADKAAGPMDEDKVPLRRTRAGVADDRLGREVRFRVEIIDPDRLDPVALHLGDGSAQPPDQLLPRIEEALRGHHRHVPALLLQHIGDGFDSLAQQGLMDPDEAIGRAAAGIHLG